MSMFSGLVLRTHPDDGIGGGCSSRISLLKASHITMEDGTIVNDWPMIVADAMSVGLNGLDQGSLAGDCWYEVYAIRRSDTGQRGLVLHRHKHYVLDQNQQNGETVIPLRYSTSYTKLAQSFKPALSGKLEILDVPLKRVGSPGGYLWFTIEADNGGTPSGTPLATSDRLMAANLPNGTIPGFNVRAVFRNPAVLTAETVYWIVLHGDYGMSSANYAEWYCNSDDDYSRGAPASYNGSAWFSGTTDFTFKVYITQFESPVVMPADFDQKRLIGFFYTFMNSPFYFDPMEWRNNKAFWLVSATGTVFTNFGYAVPIVVDSNILFPHGVAVEADIVVKKETNAGFVMVGGVPDGYLRWNQQYRHDGTVTGHIAQPGESVFAGTVASDFGGLYINTDGTQKGTVYMPSWSWT